jgi:ligand-binding SRPBCC domain-containing protein
MNIERLVRSQQLPISLETAWQFFSDPANLSQITPPSLNFNVISELPGYTYPGMIAAYTITPIGPFKFTWVTEISHTAEPNYFVDEQRFGPYRFWHHQHRFREIPGGVSMDDTVHYLLPYWPVGMVLTKFVARQLDGIFDYRQEALRQLFGEYVLR